MYVTVYGSTYRVDTEADLFHLPFAMLVRGKPRDVSDARVFERCSRERLDYFSRW